MTTTLRALRLAHERMRRSEDRVRAVVAMANAGNEAAASALEALLPVLASDIERVRELTAKCREAA